MDYESFSRARGPAPAGDRPRPWLRAGLRLHRVLVHVPLRRDRLVRTRTRTRPPRWHHASVALERGGDDPLALAIYGHGQSFLLKDYDTALTYLDRAIEAGPSSAMAWTMSSCTRGYIGDGERRSSTPSRAFASRRWTARLFWHEGLLGQAHYVEGNYEKALEWVQSALSRNRSIRYNHRTLIATLVALGRHEEAAEAARALLRIQPDFRLGPYSRQCPFVPRSSIRGLPA